MAQSKYLLVHGILLAWQVTYAMNICGRLREGGGGVEAPQRDSDKMFEVEVASTF